MILGGAAMIVVVLIVGDARANLASYVCYAFLIYLFWSRKAALAGEEPQHHGEAQSGGPLSLAAEQGKLIGTQRPGFFDILPALVQFHSIPGVFCASASFTLLSYLSAPPWDIQLEGVLVQDSPGDPLA